MNANTQWARDVAHALLLMPSVVKLIVTVEWMEIQGRGRAAGSKNFTRPVTRKVLESLTVPEKVEALRVFADGSEADSMTDQQLIEWATTLLKDARVIGQVEASFLAKVTDAPGTRWYRVIVDHKG